MSTDQTSMVDEDLCLSPEEAVTSFQAWPAAKRALLEKYAAADIADEPVELEPPAPEPDWEAIEALKETARAEGFAQGMTDAEAAIRQAVAEHVKRLETVHKALTRPLATLDAAIEDQVVELALEIGSTLFRGAIERSPQQIQAVVREAVQLLPVATNDVTIYLHPEDAPLLRESGSTQAAWQIVEDANMERGGCRVTTAASDVDATVSGRLQALREALLET